MRLSDVDWSVLSRSLILLVVAVAASAAVMAGGYSYAQNMQKQYAAQKRRLVSIRTNYQTIDQQRHILETYLPRYRHLAGQGIIGAERRLDWLEALQKLSHEMRLPSVVYELSSREPYTPEFTMAGSRFKVYASDMKLTLGLLHEGDLPALLAGLARRAHGLYTVTGCHLSRRGSTIRMLPMADNVNAECTLRWYTIEPPPKKGGSA